MSGRRGIGGVKVDLMTNGKRRLWEEIWLSLCAILFWREVRGLRCGCGGVVLVVILMMLLLSCAPLNSGEVAGGWAYSAANVYTPRLRSEVFIPSFWIDQTATIDRESAEKLLEYGRMLKMAEGYAAQGKVGGGVVIVVAVVLIGVSCFCWRRRKGAGR